MDCQATSTGEKVPPKMCQEPFCCFLGRPRGRSVISRPRRRTILSDHEASPNGQPRLTARRRAASSASVCAVFTSFTQRLGRSRGQADSHDAPPAVDGIRRCRLHQRQSSARSTSFARRAFRST